MVVVVLSQYYVCLYTPDVSLFLLLTAHSCIGYPDFIIPCTGDFPPPGRELLRSRSTRPGGSAGRVAYCGPILYRSIYFLISVYGNIRYLPQNLYARIIFGAYILTISTRKYLGGNSENAPVICHAIMCGMTNYIYVSSASSHLLFVSALKYIRPFTRDNPHLHCVPGLH